MTIQRELKYFMTMEDLQNLLTRRDCRDCRYCWCECGEDIVCGHPQSYAETAFGRSVNYARRAGNFCGPDGILFNPRPYITLSS